MWIFILSHIDTYYTYKYLCITDVNYKYENITSTNEAISSKNWDLHGILWCFWQSNGDMTSNYVYITLHYITLYYMTLHYIILYHIILYCIILYYIILYYIILYNILYYITLHYIVDCMHASNIQCRAWNFAPLNMIVEALESTLGSLAPRFSRLCTTMDLSFRKDLPTGVEVVFRLPDCSFHHVQESQGEQMI